MTHNNTGHVATEVPDTKDDDDESSEADWGDIPIKRRPPTPKTTWSSRTEPPASTEPRSTSTKPKSCDGYHLPTYPP